ncbi:hypothetical protein SJAG_01348 [Schizosaccharomyces japonicus yFS275]|uniref:Uncharacterized protein n=1 Tax=Schizosaccharomyces japonicus (strain yFS275 / FY16936) TaxID=402676 RepID=B6K0F4_SCHJY|nr:hypothetical protein SJAG_01348 [Schizosaccharomyces japonicus yFS275]EEB06304.1 hypothetical protein SJAG_01348 [Schizosaccharomyces japonicus yFS275]
MSNNASVSVNSGSAEAVRKELPQIVQTSLFDVGCRIRKAVKHGYSFDQKLFPSYQKDDTLQTELPQQKHDPSLKLSNLKSDLAAESIFWDTSSVQSIADDFADPKYMAK